MNLRTLIFPAALLLSAGTALSAPAQNPTSGTSASASGQTSQARAQATEPLAGKKVWTNDNLNSLQANSAISTVGPSSAASTKPGNKPAATKSSSAKSYQDQIARLQSQIPPLDSQIAELQSAIDGKPTGDAKDSSRPRNVKIDDWSVEMQQLQKKRDDIATRISALQDQARHQGAAEHVAPSSHE